MDSTLHKILDFVESLELSEGEYIDICNRLKFAFGNKEDIKKDIEELETVIEGLTTALEEGEDYIDVIRDLQECIKSIKEKINK